MAMTRLLYRRGKTLGIAAAWVLAFIISTWTVYGFVSPYFTPYVSFSVEIFGVDDNDVILDIYNTGRSNIIPEFRTSCYKTTINDNYATGNPSFLFLTLAGTSEISRSNIARTIRYTINNPLDFEDLDKIELTGIVNDIPVVSAITRIAQFECKLSFRDESQEFHSIDYSLKYTGQTIVVEGERIDVVILGAGVGSMFLNE